MKLKEIDFISKIQLNDELIAPLFKLNWILILR